MTADARPSRSHAPGPGQHVNRPALDPIAEARRQWELRHDAALPMEVVVRLFRAQQLALGHMNELLAPFGLTFARYEVLKLLAFSRTGRLPMGKMGERLMVHPTSVTSAVNRLEAQGLVERVPGDHDRRTTLAVLTEAGRELVDRATDALVADGFGMSDLSDEGMRELAGGLERLCEELEGASTGS
ncbi:MarR family transcriptional regulator [Egibacter rhizosphaerae]|uniref:MarR family transcriptional regulator n=1 Tax=Egibacter rhizosphaerae TaxID=1670831 RepID=A0A411YBS7_9ACTN|nr:MarR family transcriptional regulator [Egibacter rhizosphaerae]QBI18635.1 MarR family transcriptional regulator [Egibacter rhizosphaerae]